MLDFLFHPFERSGHREGDPAAEGVPTQHIGALGLDSVHGLNVVLSDPGYTDVRLRPTVQPLPGLSHQVGDDPFVLTHIDGDNGNTFDVGMPDEEGFDFTELDAMPAHLDLMVNATQELDGAVVAIVGEIAAVVETGARGIAEGVRDELLGGERGPPVIAPARSGTADVQFTWYTDGCRIGTLVENVNFLVSQGPADEDASQVSVSRSGSTWWKVALAVASVGP